VIIQNLLIKFFCVKLKASDDAVPE